MKPPPTPTLLRTSGRRGVVVHAIVALATVLAAAPPCQAHALAPSAFPLGPMPFSVLSDWWWWVFPVMGAVALELLLLRLVVRQVSLWGNAWRGILLYFLARAWECALLWAIPALGDDFMYGLTWSTVALILLGILIRVPLVKLIYARKKVLWPRAMVAGVVPGAASYVVLAGVACFTYC